MRLLLVQINEGEFSKGFASWQPVDEQSTELFNPWTVKVKNLGLGSHRIWARTVSPDGSSLYSFIDVNVVEKSPGDSSGIGGISMTWVILGLISLAAVGIILYMKRKK